MGDSSHTDTDSLLNQANAVIGRYAGAELSIDGVYLPDMSPPDGEMVNILSEAVTDLGQPVPVPDIAISDCRYRRQQGIPAYRYGLGGDLCSAANEYVRVDDLLLTVKTHALAACRYLSSIA
ncbi:MAG: M20/M25/M40 family metallo-hydrolase [Succinivibrio sp.]|nr:M20/M25/M40 family metallo-hydrolase [Succinivibrio sp.]